MKQASQRTADGVRIGANMPYLPDKIRYLRESRGWSQAQLAEVASTTQPVISRIEKGIGAAKRPDLDLARRIAGALDVELPAIFVTARTPDVRHTSDSAPNADALDGGDRADILAPLLTATMELGSQITGADAAIVKDAIMEAPNVVYVRFFSSGPAVTVPLIKTMLLACKALRERDGVAAPTLEEIGLESARLARPRKVAAALDSLPLIGARRKARDEQHRRAMDLRRKPMPEGES